MKDQTFANIAERLRGDVIGPDDPGYAEACKLYNGMIDKRPAMIARCANVADVIAAVNFGRDNDLPLAIRGGGHSGPGLGSVDDGLVIDLSQMRDVRVDPQTRTVRVGPGCTSGDVDHATHAFGLAVPFGIIASTGVGGLTLGGGSGYLTRRYGLTIDNLIEADVVLADGHFVTASADENADLFWALRGGGGNFGVVTSFLFRAHPVATVFAGPVFWGLDDARAVMQAFRDFQGGAPREVGGFVGLKTVPPVDPFPPEHQGKRACAIIACYDGDAQAGTAAMAPLMDRLPPPLFDWRAEMPFPALQAMFDPFFPSGLQWYWKGAYVTELPEAAIDAHIAQIEKAPSDLSLMHLYPVDGAAAAIKPENTAWPARDAKWSMVIAAVDPDPAKADGLKDWAQGYWNAVRPYTREGGYVNFLMGEEDTDRIAAAYSTNHARLARIKARYDPANLFRVNQNIAPAVTP
ncbi:FAD-binding oxidoreductase [Roseinatronobacter alkalisoli]|uniref:FAD-binding oxidoreductase n=1 Tax=Roseinatronobacter alkalisoli TaxID=3028235 RepID=A0ABT5TFC3_9RHOB|nr:FAD-binding oxidoreductase [Roseinatronobacter sp. HJB301]MDD7973814.1 FAD-binding oxidoreductase [Roseinatronobacter sp. HJB301]